MNIRLQGVQLEFDEFCYLGSMIKNFEDAVYIFFFSVIHTKTNISHVYVCIGKSCSRYDFNISSDDCSPF